MTGQQRAVTLLLIVLSARSYPRIGISSTVMIVSTIAAMALVAVHLVPRFCRAPLTLPLQETMWTSFREPTVSFVGAGGPVELGVVVRPLVRGTIAGVRFYRLAGDVGPHVGTVWRLDGERLATALFVAESDVGWQETQLPDPLAVEAGEEVVVSYFSPTGGNMAVGDRFAHAGQPLATGSSSFRYVLDGTNGTNRYGLGPSSFPSVDAGAKSFWVDVLFTQTRPLAAGGRA